MRYPRILTCSSARPRYSSCPSGRQHTKSPVRYIRAPGAPNGHATNRDPVNPVRRQYPTPTPRPATYNSPTTPPGTGRNQPSSTKKAAPGTGEPIGGAPEPAARGALLDAHIVVSVGPYTLTITRPGAHRSTTSAGQASAPITNAADPNPSGDNPLTAEGVWVSTLTCSPTSNAWKSSGERATDSGTTTSRPPCSSAPQISQTETSKANECHCDHTFASSGAVRSAFSDSSSRVTLWWVMATPLGTPVVPE